MLLLLSDEEELLLRLTANSRITSRGCIDSLRTHYGTYTLKEGVTPKAVTKALEKYFAGDLDALTSRADGHKRNPIPTRSMEGSAKNSQRKNRKLWRIGGDHRKKRSAPSRGSRKRRQPHRHRSPLPPRNRSQRFPHRLRQRTSTQKMVVGPRKKNSRIK